MTITEKDLFDRYRRASQILIKNLEPSASMLAIAENSGCLNEMEYLIEELREWLDDDEYYADLAWNQLNPEK